MTKERARAKYGVKDDDGYVWCSDCPLHGICNTNGTTGHDACWEKIAKELTEPTEEPTGEVDLVNQPPHYKHGMECIDEMILIFGIEATSHYCLLAAWKYRKRSPFKGNPEQDMDKSDWYIAKYKELKELMEKDKDEWYPK